MPPTTVKRRLPTSFSEWVVGVPLPSTLDSKHNKPSKPESLPGPSKGAKQAKRRDVFRFEVLTDDEDSEDTILITYPRPGSRPKKASSHELITTAEQISEPKKVHFEDNKSTAPTPKSAPKSALKKTLQETSPQVAEPTDASEPSTSNESTDVSTTEGESASEAEAPKAKSEKKKKKKKTKASSKVEELPSSGDEDTSATTEFESEPELVTPVTTKGKKKKNRKSTQAASVSSLGASSSSEAYSEVSGADSEPESDCDCADCLKERRTQAKSLSMNNQKSKHKKPESESEVSESESASEKQSKNSKPRTFEPEDPSETSESEVSIRVKQKKNKEKPANDKKKSKAKKIESDKGTKSVKIQTSKRKSKAAVISDTSDSEIEFEFKQKQSDGKRKDEKKKKQRAVIAASTTTASDSEDQVEVKVQSRDKIKKAKRSSSRKDLEADILTDTAEADSPKKRSKDKKEKKEKDKHKKDEKKSKKAKKSASDSSPSAEALASSSKTESPSLVTDVAETKDQQATATVFKDVATSRPVDQTSPTASYGYAEPLPPPHLRRPNFLVPARAQVLQVEHVVEGQEDPTPNAFVDQTTGVVRVYHGPVYGNQTGMLYPPRDHSAYPLPLGTPHPSQNSHYWGFNAAAGVPEVACQSQWAPQPSHIRGALAQAAAQPGPLSKRQVTPQHIPGADFSPARQPADSAMKAASNVGNGGWNNNVGPVDKDVNPMSRWGNSSNKTRTVSNHSKGSARHRPHENIVAAAAMEPSGGDGWGTIQQPQPPETQWGTDAEWNTTAQDPGDAWRAEEPAGYTAGDANNNQSNAWPEAEAIANGWDNTPANKTSNNVDWIGTTENIPTTETTDWAATTAPTQWTAAPNDTWGTTNEWGVDASAYHKPSVHDATDTADPVAHSAPTPNEATSKRWGGSEPTNYVTSKNNNHPFSLKHTTVEASAKLSPSLLKKKSAPRSKDGAPTDGPTDGSLPTAQSAKQSSAGETAGVLSDGVAGDGGVWGGADASASSGAGAGGGGSGGGVGLADIGGAWGQASLGTITAGEAARGRAGNNSAVPKGGGAWNSKMPGAWQEEQPAVVWSAWGDPTAAQGNWPR